MTEEQDTPSNEKKQKPVSEEVQNESVTEASETKNKTMEVHHHPDVEKKNFKGYILEGLMIFLAETMGFIAENIREQITEHKNAKILAQSMLEDIKKDTASLHMVIAFSYQKLSASDSILAIVHKPRDKWNDTNFYKNMSPILTSYPFISTDGTYAQMKTSGTLRYFNQSLVNQMNAYDVQLKKTEYRDNVEDKGTWITGPFNFDIINLEVMGDIRFNNPITHEMYIKFADKAMIDKFVNLVTLMKMFRTRSLMEYQEQLKIADKLIEALKKEYNLD
jgi:hypothetical protein